jgi:hypothetical protein
MNMSGWVLGAASPERGKRTLTVSCWMLDNFSMFLATQDAAFVDSLHRSTYSYVCVVPIPPPSQMKKDTIDVLMTPRHLLFRKDCKPYCSKL